MKVKVHPHTNRGAAARAGPGLAPGDTSPSWSGAPASSKALDQKGLPQTIIRILQIVRRPTITQRCRPRSRRTRAAFTPACAGSAMACGVSPQVSSRLVGAAAAVRTGRGDGSGGRAVVPPPPTPPDHRKTGDGRRAAPRRRRTAKMRLNRSSNGNRRRRDAAPFGATRPRGPSPGRRPSRRTRLP